MIEKLTEKNFSLEEVKLFFVKNFIIFFFLEN